MSNTESGREPVTLVEIDQAICVNRFGVAPCAAALLPSVPHKCFNTMRTCADTANFDLDTIPLTLRFCKSMQVVPRTWGAVPCLESVSTTPMQLNPGGASKNSGPLGARATVTIKMRDLPSADFRVDLYQSERYSGAAQFSGAGYNPLDRGSLWSKWIRRNPYYANWFIRIREGYIEDDPATMITRTYIIEDISEPDSKGSVTIKAQDIFGLADNDKAQCPAASNGLLSVDLTATGYTVNIRHVAAQWTKHGATTIYYYVGSILDPKPDFVLVNGVAYTEVAWGGVVGGQWAWTDQDGLGYNTVYIKLNDNADPDSKADGYVVASYTTSFPLTDWVAGEYPAGGGTIRIGDECMTFTAAAEGATLCVLSGIVRGTDGTTAETHSIGDRAQLCYRVTAVPCWEVAQELLQTYAGVPATYIDAVAWADEYNSYLPSMTATTLITEPTGVNQLLGELCQQYLFDIWWDERDQEIKFKALRSSTTAPYILNDKQNIMPGWTTKVDMGQRVSEVWVFYKQKDPTKKLDDTKNYSAVHIIDDPSLELAKKYGSPAIKMIFSRWLESDAQCIQLVFRYLARYQDGAKYIKFRLDAKDRSIWTGAIVETNMYSMVDAVGIPEGRRWQVISAEEVIPGEVVEYNCLNMSFAASRYLVWQVGGAGRTGKWADASGLVAGIKGYSWK
jgi:hypothetical protein